MKKLIDNYLPLKTAYTGVSCAHCMATGDKLLVCTKCRRAKYCNRNCQVADWKHHKHACKHLQQFRQEYFSIERPIGGHPLILMSDSPLYRSFIMFCRVCVVCQQNEYDGDFKWRRCHTCNYGWCCSSDHWEQSRADHEKVCGIYKRSMDIDRFLRNHVSEYDDVTIFVPEKPLTTPMTTFPKTWEDYTKKRSPEIGKALDRLPPEYLPAATFQLSQVVTILYGIYKFQLEPFLSGKDMDQTLNIHILGPSEAQELYPTHVWEEILHFLPSVQHLHLSFIGPDSDADFDSSSNLECCPDCTRRDRTRKVLFRKWTYHQFRRQMDPSHEFYEPDIVVAYNTGLFEEFTESWEETLEVILDMNVPAIFTSYCLSEAEADCAVIERHQASLLDRPRENPFAIDHDGIDVNAADTFYRVNDYITFFRGRG